MDFRCTFTVKWVDLDRVIVQTTDILPFSLRLRTIVHFMPNISLKVFQMFFSLHWLATLLMTWNINFPQNLNSRTDILMKIVRRLSNPICYGFWVIMICDATAFGWLCSAFVWLWNLLIGKSVPCKAAFIPSRMSNMNGSHPKGVAWSLRNILRSAVTWQRTFSRQPYILEM